MPSPQTPPILRESTLSLYTASAGAGKTFQLVFQYLHQCFRAQSAGSPLPFRSLLAITFTNKAAAEMKHRIIRALSTYAQIIPAEEAEKSDQQIGALLLQTLPGWNEDRLREASNQLLHAIMHHYGLFSVSTIDQFTHRIIRSFANDLDMRPDFDVEMNMDVLYEETVKRMMAAVGEDNNELSRLIQKLNAIALEESNEDNLTQKMKGAAKLILKNTLQAHFEKLAEVDESIWTQTSTRYYAQRNAHFEKGKALYQRLLELLPEGVSLNDFHGGFGTAVKKLEQPVLAKVDEYKGNTLKVLNGNFAGKDKVAAMRAAGFEDGVERAFMSWLEDWKAYHTQTNRLVAYKSIMASLPYAQFLGRLMRSYHALKQDLNVVGISEFDLIINQELQRTPEAFIYERIGERYETYFIDEFQDTSKLQWENLHPLISNALASGGRTMLVGDAKQSIYSFRDADVQNFLSILRNDGSPGAQVETLRLKENYRSRAKVVAFNNELLGLMSRRFADSQLQQVYAEGVQDVPEGTLAKEPGYVRATLCAKGENPLEAVEEHVIDILNRGFKASDIAILVRRAVTGGKIAEQILGSEELKGRGIGVISEDAMNLANNDHVLLLIATLKWMTQPEDKHHQALWLHQLVRLGKINHVDELHQAIQEERFLEAIQATPLAIDPVWWNRPVPEVIDYLLALYDFGDCPFSLTLLEHAHDYMHSKHRWEQSFLEYFETLASRWQVNAGQSENSLYIGTIHKSKGLEFPVVILPLDGWKIVHQDASEWVENKWCETDGSPFAGIPFLQIPIKSMKMLEEYREELADWEERNRMDHVNLFYVGSTRAVDELHLVLPPKPGPQAVTEYLPGWIREHLAEGFGWDDGVNVLGEPIVLKHSAEGAAEVEQDASPVDRVGAEDRSVARSMGRGRLAHSSERLKIAAQRRKSWDETPDTARDFGVLMHRLLAEINRVGDEERWIQSGLAAGEITPETAETLRTQMERLWENEQLRAWFSTEDRVYAEREIAQPNGTFYRPDRVIMSASPVVIDFKTGAAHAQHEDQVQGYMRLIAQLSDREPTGALVYLSANEVVVKNVKFAAT